MNNYRTGNHTKRSMVSYSGLLLFISGFIIFMGIITGEMLYTLDFTTRDNYISELAAALPLGTLTPQPSGIIFNLTMMLSGLLVMLSSILTFISLKKLLASIPLFLFGLGLLGVGIFPGDVVPWHGIFANVIFLAGGIGAIASFRIVGDQMRYVFIFLGVLSLVFLFTYKHLVPLMGVGGAERWVFYPLIFWITGLGGYLFGMGMQPKWND